MRFLLFVLGVLTTVAGIGILVQDSAPAGFVVIGVGVALVFLGRRRRRSLLRTPQDVTKSVVEQFDRLSEKEIGKAESIVQGLRGGYAEAQLLYALRVSKCVPTLKSLKTLASRWSTANVGAGAAGLQMGRDAKNWQLVSSFLARLYLKHYKQLCLDLVSKTKQAVADRKSPQARSNVVNKAIALVNEAHQEFSYQLPGLNEATGECLIQLQKTGDSDAS
jgi:hypothetical protein